jgi:hypothetical protein
MLKGFDAQTSTPPTGLPDAEILQLLALARKSGLAAALEAATKAGQLLMAIAG